MGRADELWSVVIPSILSIFGSLFIIVSYVTFQKLRSSVGTYVLWFALSGFGNSLYPFLGSGDDGSPLCIIQSLIGTYFLLSTFFTSTILSHLLYSIFHRPSRQPIQISILEYLYCWGLPIILVCIPFTTNSYGRDNDRFISDTLISHSHLSVSLSVSLSLSLSLSLSVSGIVGLSPRMEAI
jgi:hypothetical protein